MYRLYKEDEGLSNIHDRGRSPRTCIFDNPEFELYNRLVPECGGVSDRGRSPRTCIFDNPEFELYNRLVPECGGVSASYWFIQSCPM